MMKKLEKYFNNDPQVAYEVMDYAINETAPDYFPIIHKEIIAKHYGAEDWDWEDAIELWSEDDIEYAIELFFNYSLQEGYENEYVFNQVKISWIEDEEAWLAEDMFTGEKDASDKVKRLTYMVPFSCKKQWIIDNYSG